MLHNLYAIPAVGFQAVPELDVDALRGELAHARLCVEQARREGCVVGRLLWQRRADRLARTLGDDDDDLDAPAMALA